MIFSKQIIAISITAILIATSATAHEITPEPTLWEKSQQISIEAWESTKEYSEESWNATRKFLEQDDNSTWATITAGGISLAGIGAASITTTSILGLVAVSSAPAWVPVAISAGGTAAAIGIVNLITDDAHE